MRLMTICTVELHQTGAAFVWRWLDEDQVHHVMLTTQGLTVDGGALPMLTATWLLPASLALVEGMRRAEKNGQVLLPEDAVRLVARTVRDQVTKDQIQVEAAEILASASIFESGGYCPGCVLPTSHCECGVPRG